MGNLNVFVVGIVAVSVLSACGPSNPGSAAGTSGITGDIRADSFCEVEGLQAPLRHTYFLIDGASISQTSSPAEFVSLNTPLRDAVLAIAGPRAIQAGVTAPRERVSIFVLPRDGSAASRVFTGCVPGVSPTELSQLRGESSAIGEFFRGGITQKIENEERSFQTRLVGALQVSAQNVEGPAMAQSGQLDETSLISSLKASARMLDGAEGVPRVVLFTDLSRVELPAADSIAEERRAGFEAARKVGLDLALSEMLIIHAGDSASISRNFFDAFLLGQNAQLVHWGDSRVGVLSLAPTRVYRFLGEATYPASNEAIQIRLGVDENGKLVNSWLVLRGRPDRATPLTGQAVCVGPEDCEILSDGGGFAQVWSLEPGGEPEFDNEAPFGGLRDFEIRIVGEVLEGRVFDPSVDQIGSNPDTTDMPIRGALQPDATF